MHALGIYGKKIAILSRIKDKITIVALREGIGDSPRGAAVVTALAPVDTIRRSITLALSREREIALALPFQIESLLPFSSEEAVVLPYLYPLDKGRTEVVLFATTKERLTAHLDGGINPDQVSSVPAALFRWSRFLFPGEEKMVVIHQGTCVVIDGDKIVAAHSLEEEKLHAYVEAKFPDHLLLKAPTKDLYDFAIPIGLALDHLYREDGRSHQFRQGPLLSPQEKKRERSRMIGYVGASLALTGMIWAFGGWKIQQRKADLEARLDPFVIRGLSLEQRLFTWDESLAAKQTLFSLSPHAPLVTNLLSWLSNRPEAIDITHLHYALVKRPTPQESQTPYVVKVDLEFSAPTLRAADEFHEALKKNTDQKVEWSVAQDLYKTSFFLRPNL